MTYRGVLLYSIAEYSVLPSFPFLKMMLQEVMSQEEKDPSLNCYSKHKVEKKKKLPCSLATSFCLKRQSAVHPQIDSSMRSIKSAAQSDLSFHFDTKIYSLDSVGKCTAQDNLWRQKHHQEAAPVPPVQPPQLDTLSKIFETQKPNPHSPTRLVDRLQVFRKLYSPIKRKPVLAKPQPKLLPPQSNTVSLSKTQSYTFLANSRLFQGGSLSTLSVKNSPSARNRPKKRLNLVMQKDLGKVYLNELKIRPAKRKAMTASYEMHTQLDKIGFRTLNFRSNIIDEANQESEAEVESEAFPFALTQQNFRKLSQQVIEASRRRKVNPLATSRAQYKRNFPDLSDNMREENAVLAQNLEDMATRYQVERMARSKIPPYTMEEPDPLQLDQIYDILREKSITKRVSIKRKKQVKHAEDILAALPKDDGKQSNSKDSGIDSGEEKDLPLLVKRKVFADVVVVTEEGKVKLSKKEVVTKRVNKLYKRKRGNKAVINNDKIWEQPVTVRHSSDDEEDPEPRRHVAEVNAFNYRTSKFKYGVGNQQIEKGNALSESEQTACPSQNVKFIVSKPEELKYKKSSTLQDKKKDKKDKKTVVVKHVSSDSGSESESEGGDSQSQSEQQKECVREQLKSEEVGVQSESVSPIVQARSDRAAIVDQLYYEDGRTTLQPQVERYDNQLNNLLLQRYNEEQPCKLEQAQLLGLKLFDKLEASQLSINLMRNPKMMHALFVLLSKSTRFILRLFQKKQLDGKLVGIWLCVGGDWHPVYVDTLLVVSRRNTVVMATCGNQLWPAFLQKAVSKAVGPQLFKRMEMFQFLELLAGSPACEFKLRENPKRNVLAFKYIEKTRGKNYTVVAEKYPQSTVQLGSWNPKQVCRVVGLGTVRSQQNSVERRFAVEEGKAEVELGEDDFCSAIQFVVGIELRVSHLMTSFVSHLESGTITILELIFRSNSRGTLCFRPVLPDSILLPQTKFKFEDAGFTVLDTSASQQPPKIKMNLYHEVEESCYRLVGEKKSSKQKSFFECNFKPGRYLLFVDHDSSDSANITSFNEIAEGRKIGYCLSYSGEERCEIRFLERVGRKEYQNERSEYVQASELQEEQKAGLSLKTERYLASLDRESRRQFVEQFGMASPV